MNAGKNLRGGLIGCGFFAQNHLHGWQEVNGADIVAVCDLEAGKATTAMRQFDSVKHAYNSVEQMFAEQKLDYVDIVTVMDSHRELVECAARHRVPVIVQKPFAPTMQDARAMVSVCDQAGVLLMVHENFRWQSPMRRIGEIISSGAIGETFFARVSFRHGNPVGYASQPYLLLQDEYIINDVGIHLFDLARFYMGEVSSVYTQTQKVNPRFKGEDVATMLLRHDNHATTLVDLSVSTQTSPDPFPQTRVTVEGSKGTVTLDRDFMLTLENSVLDKPGPASREQWDVSPVVYDWAQQPWAIVQESVVNIQQHWVDCLVNGQTPETSGADNLKVLELTFLAYESARTGNCVSCMA